MRGLLPAQQGGLLIEATLAVFIFSLLVIGALSGVGSGKRELADAGFVQGVHAIVAGTQRHYAGDYRGLHEQRLRQLGIIPLSFVHANGISVRAPYGGLLVVRDSGQFAGAYAVPGVGRYEAASFRVEALPADSCAASAPALAVNAAALWINDRLAKADPTATLTTAAALGLCTAHSNRIAFTVY